MVRQLVRVSAAIAFAALLAPGTPQAAPPPGLQYDELVQIVVSGTPPPPGNFQHDVAAANASTPAPVAAAPRRRGISLGNIAGAVLSGNAGNVAGAVAGEAASEAIAAAMERSLSATFAGLAASINEFLRPHVLRYAYWNGWERVDDLTTQTATIRKCDMGQVVKLDLAKRTYSVITPDADVASTPEPAPRARAPRPATPAPPGTGVVTLSSATRTIGTPRIENLPTTGYDTTTTFAMTQATGSCRNGNASFETIEYLPALTRPAVNSCPIRREPIPESPRETVEMPSGGCRPSFTAQASGAPPPSNRLSLYTFMRMTGGSGGTPPPNSSGLGFLTERGNLKSLGPSDAALFEIPQGFTKAS